MLDSEDHARQLQHAASVDTADVAAITAEGQVGKPDSAMSDCKEQAALLGPQWSSL